ncbi:hypothetical protein ABPG77_001357 [Micractinium sp. CCAP 211/92]
MLGGRRAPSPAAAAGSDSSGSQPAEEAGPAPGKPAGQEARGPAPLQLAAEAVHLSPLQLAAKARPFLVAARAFVCSPLLPLTAGLLCWLGSGQAATAAQLAMLVWAAQLGLAAALQQFAVSICSELQKLYRWQSAAEVMAAQNREGATRGVRVEDQTTLFLGFTGCLAVLAWASHVQLLPAAVQAVLEVNSPWVLAAQLCVDAVLAVRACKAAWAYRLFWAAREDRLEANARRRAAGRSAGQQP